MDTTSDEAYCGELPAYCVPVTVNSVDGNTTAIYEHGDAIYAIYAIYGAPRVSRISGRLPSLYQQKW